MKSEKQHPEICPLCEEKYTEKNIRTRHHLFPKYWFKGQGIRVVACSKCHTYTFHVFYPMDLKNPWTKKECLNNWVTFCRSKGKDAFKIYPQLIGIKL